MFSKSLSSVQSRKGNKNPTTPPLDRQPCEPSNSLGRTAPGPCLPFSRTKLTDPGPTRAYPFSSTSPTPTLPAARGARPRNTNSKLNAVPPPSNSSSSSSSSALSASGHNQQKVGPFDNHIIELLQHYKAPKDYMSVLKADLVQYLGLQCHGGKVYHQWDGHVAQLVRVMEQLEKTGECVVAGKIVRP